MVVAVFTKMATELVSGSIPPLYREIYDIVLPDETEYLDHDCFVKIFTCSALQKPVLSQIWEISCNGQPKMTRSSFYKALALIALAQQGKTVSEKLLDAYSRDELPKPSLGDLTALKASVQKVRRENNPTMLSFTFEELCAFDTVSIELMPEKRGILLKHVEYEVSSQTNKCTVQRRYTDFVALQELLLLRYPYRLVPRLPPKKMMTDKEFIEQRRRALRRFLNLIVRHPVMKDDDIVKYFLTFPGTDMQTKMREHFKNQPDEFMTNPLSLKAKDYVPVDIQQQLIAGRELVHMLEESFGKIRDVAERMISRMIQHATDMQTIASELRSLANTNVHVTAWATGRSSTWSNLKKGFQDVSTDFLTLSDKTASQAVKEDNSVVELFSYFTDLLAAHQDLTKRQEKGVLAEHQRTLQKMGQYKKKKVLMPGQGDGDSNFEQVEQQILRQEVEISNLENRNSFSQLCLQMETQLVHANLQAVYNALHSMSLIEGEGLIELASLWKQLLPSIEGMLPKEASTLNVVNHRRSVSRDTQNGLLSASPAVSPLNSPVSPNKPWNP